MKALLVGLILMASISTFASTMITYFDSFEDNRLITLDDISLRCKSNIKVKLSIVDAVNSFREKRIYTYAYINGMMRHLSCLSDVSAMYRTLNRAERFLVNNDYLPWSALSFDHPEELKAYATRHYNGWLLALNEKIEEACRYEL